MLALGDGLVGAGLPVAALLIDFGPPPLEAVHPARVYEAEEDDDDAKRQAGIEGGAERHGVLAPPSGVPVLDEVVEDVADNDPDGEVEPRGGRDPGHGAEDDGEVDLAEEALATATAVQPERDGEEGAQGEEPDESAVDGRGAEELVRADDAPEDRPVEVHAGNGAGEAVDSLGGAEPLYVCEHPVEHADLGDGRDERGDNLHGEEDAWRNLHVVAEFEVGSELDALRRRDVAVRDEDHVGDGAAREDDAADELADEVDAAVLVRHRHDDAVGDEEEGADGEREQEAVPR